MNLYKYIFLITLKSVSFVFLFINIICASEIKNSATIFMYHKFGVSKYPSTSVTIDQLENHISELKKQKYNIRSLDFIVDTIINDGDLPNNTIGISVDDADKSFFEVGWPLFKKNNIPVTLFVTTGTIVKDNKNYINWDQIRKLKEEGVTIGAHSHTHAHMANIQLDEVRSEIETSNKIFLKELGEIPTLFAYPYGETTSEIIDLIKDYKFKVAFGQHSGIINETSNMYYLPRFSLNEKYGEIDRVKFAANAKGIGIYDFIPINPTIKQNPPFIGFSLLDSKKANSLDCFIFDSKGQVDREIYKFNERIEIRLTRELSSGRSRMNCTVKDADGHWRWFGHQFYF